VEKTKVFGCSTKWSDKRGSAVESIERWNREPVSLERLDVEEVRKLARNDSKNLRLINVWATWCGPCVAELDEFVTINRMYRGRNFELVTISADSPEKGEEQALKVLTDKHVSCTNYLFDSDDKYALIDALDKQWPGPLPHTVLVEPGGKVIYRHNGPIEALELKKAVVEYLGRTY
jgi:thiol-disulfide isomerase/thioredoxin